MKIFILFSILIISFGLFVFYFKFHEFFPENAQKTKVFNATQVFLLKLFEVNWNLQMILYAVMKNWFKRKSSKIHSSFFLFRSLDIDFLELKVFVFIQNWIHLAFESKNPKTCNKIFDFDTQKYFARKNSFVFTRQFEHVTRVIYEF